MLSIIIITKNAELTLADCIANIKDLADELLVVDSGSIDRTTEVARMHGATVHTHEFANFADQRNFAFKQTKGEWILYLDADEFASKAFVREVKHTIEHSREDGQIGGYFIKRKTYYFGRDWGLTDSVQRLFYRQNFIRWEGVVHETPKIKGEFGVIAAPVHHFTHQNLSQMLEKTNKWSEYEAKLRFDAGHPPMNALRFIRVMATGFLDSYIKGKGYKNGTEGLIEAVYQGYSLFVTYAKLWELQSQSEKKHNGGK